MIRVTGVPLIALAVGAIGFTANSAEGTLPNVAAGNFINYLGDMEPEWRVTLDLRRDGGATYTISSWEDGRNPLDKKRESLRGRWVVEADILTVNLSDEHAGKAVTYKVTPCLDYITYSELRCSPGLEPMTNTMPARFSQALWYVVRATRAH